MEVKDDTVLETATKQVFKQHKRKVSQFHALKKLFGEQVEEEEVAISLARNAMIEHVNTNKSGNNNDDIDIDIDNDADDDNNNNNNNTNSKFEVKNARFDDEEYMVLTDKETNKATLVIKKPNSNNQEDHSPSVESNEKNLQNAIDRAFNEHTRKVSQYRSLQESLKHVLGENVGPQAAQHIMKSVRGAQPNVHGTGRRDSVRLEPAEEVNDENNDEEAEEVATTAAATTTTKTTTTDSGTNPETNKGYVSIEEIENPNMRILLLEKELAIKTEMVGRMQIEIEELRHQKLILLFNANEAINELRHAVLDLSSKLKKRGKQ